MPLILGIVASGNYPRVTNSYESISTVTVGAGGSSSITFSSIPSTYKHLQIRALVRATHAVTNGAWFAQYNSDTGSNYYSYHLLYGNGSSAGAVAGGTGTSMLWGDYVGANGAASTFGVAVVDVLDYQNTNKYKTSRGLYGFDLNGSGTIALASNLWMNTNAISSITLTPSSNNFAQYSQFALYGIKG